MTAVIIISIFAGILLVNTVIPALFMARNWKRIPVWIPDKKIILLGLLEKYWRQILCFALAVACDAGMDYFNFNVPYNSGYWSLHTIGSKFDAWHTLKVIKFTFIAIGMAPTWDFIAIAGALNYIIHEYVYKRLKRR